MKTIDSLIGPELLGVLARMGHGDTVAVVDNNFPSYAAGIPVIRMDGQQLIEAVSAILTLLPIDTFNPTPVARMAAVDDPEAVPAVAAETISLIESIENRPISVEVLERGDFYARVRAATAVVATGESRPYGCFILTKGVIRPTVPES
nr:RbsD/FucU domain-containing protein [Diaminobutyricibacter tongyongensis]